LSSPEVNLRGWIVGWNSTDWKIPNVRRRVFFQGKQLLKEFTTTNIEEKEKSDGPQLLVEQEQLKKALKSTRERRPCRPITFSLISIFQEKEKQRQTASKNNKEPWCSKLTTSSPPTWQKKTNHLCWWEYPCNGWNLNKSSTKHWHRKKISDLCWS